MKHRNRTFIESFVAKYHDLHEGHSPELDTWPLFGSPIPIVTLLVSYTIFVLYLGPKWMRDRKPFNLKYIIILYNAGQVYYNYWILSSVSQRVTSFKENDTLSQKEM